MVSSPLYQRGSVRRECVRLELKNSSHFKVVNLLDMGTEWKADPDDRDLFEGRDRATGELRWTGTRVDLIFGSNSQRRALAEAYGCEDSREKFVRYFVAAWQKVMSLDRYDLA